MLRDLFVTTGVLLAAILLYRFHAPILAVLRRFDARNVARKRQELLDRQDRLAHYKHTLRLAEEQVEEINEIAMPDERTGQPVSRFLFAGEIFATRDEAEAARNEMVVAKAREFYVELPAALAHRGKGKLRGE
jgi:hypothetical protein